MKKSLYIVAPFLLFFGCAHKFKNTEKALEELERIEKEFAPELDMYQKLNREQTASASITVQEEQEIKLRLKKEVPIKWKNHGSWFTWCFLGDTCMYHWYLNNYIKDTLTIMLSARETLKATSQIDFNLVRCEKIINMLQLIRDNFEAIFSEQLTLEKINSSRR